MDIAALLLPSAEAGKRNVPGEQVPWQIRASSLYAPLTKAMPAPTTSISRRPTTSKPRLKKHPCDWPGCGKLFGRPSDATRHYRIHTNDRRYVCNFKYCGKRFIQRSALTVHLRTHSGERPHHCEFANCDKKFSDSSSLARHRRIHTGNRPYHCHSCPKSYTKKYLLNRHIERHHEPMDPRTSCDADRPLSLSNVVVARDHYPPHDRPAPLLALNTTSPTLAEAIPASAAYASPTFSVCTDAASPKNHLQQKLTLNHHHTLSPQTPTIAQWTQQNEFVHHHPAPPQSHHVRTAPHASPFAPTSSLATMSAPFALHPPSITLPTML